MKKNKVIIFDFDGVIVNSIDVSFNLNKETIVDLEFSEWQSWFEGNIYRTVRKELLYETVETEFYNKYSDKLIELLPVEGIDKVVKEISKMGYNLVIISSSVEEAINKFLEKYSLKKYFVEVMGKETSRSKVEKFKMIFDKYKIKSKETLMVTDTVGDVKEAKEVGIKTIGTSWGVHEPERLRKNGVDFMAEKPENIILGIKELLALN